MGTTMPHGEPKQFSAPEWQHLCGAIDTGDPGAILATIPEPPHFMPILFSLDASIRDTILAGVLPAFETDEDRWELIEAAAMDSIARPERGAFAAVAQYIPLSLLDDARKLVRQLPDGLAQQYARDALEVRAATLGVSSQ